MTKVKATTAAPTKPSKAALRRAGIEEAKERLHGLLRNCRAGKARKQTVLITCSDWRSSASGLSCKIDVRLMGYCDGNCMILAYLNNIIHDALGFRQAKDWSLTMGGLNYCRSDEIASALATLAGHPIFVQSFGESGGPNGWVEPV